MRRPHDPRAWARARGGAQAHGGAHRRTVGWVMWGQDAGGRGGGEERKAEGGGERRREEALPFAGPFSPHLLSPPFFTRSLSPLMSSRLLHKGETEGGRERGGKRAGVAGDDPAGDGGHGETEEVQLVDMRFKLPNPSPLSLQRAAEVEQAPAARTPARAQPGHSRLGHNGHGRQSCCRD